MFVCSEVSDTGDCVEWVEVGPLLLPPLSASDGAIIGASLLTIAAVGWGVRYVLRLMGVW